MRKGQCNPALLLAFLCRGWLCAFNAVADNPEEIDFAATNNRIEGKSWSIEKVRMPDGR